MRYLFLLLCWLILAAPAWASGLAYDIRLDLDVDNGTLYAEAELDYLNTLDFKILVPSHGPVATDKKPIQQTYRYVSWLRDTFQQAATLGLDMAEVLALEKPAEFRRLAVLEAEYERSVSHIYSEFEEATLPLVGGAEN